MATKFLNDTGLSYFWFKLKAYFAPKAHTHNAFETKHSYTTAANAAKNWYRIANANTSQTDTTNPIHGQFILTAYNASYDVGYYERWFVNAEVFGRTAHIVIFGNTGAPFSQARILYENTIADLDADDRPAIDIYLNYKLANGTTKIEIEEVYNQGWTFVADGQLAASTVPSGFENVSCSVRSNGIERSTYADYVSYLNRQISNFTTAFTLADSYLYRSRTLNCTGTFTITIPSINSGYMWCVIKNKNTSSGVITLHPSTTSVLIDGSNADITLQPMEYVCIHSAGADNYSLIADGRWKSQKADKATTLAGYGITDAKIVNGTITLGSSSITPLTSVPSHNQASNTINAMTGYSKPSSGGAIAAGDTLNQAIGKLEKAIDDADISNVVHLTGNEDVYGVKSFYNNMHIYGYDGTSDNSAVTTLALHFNDFTVGTSVSDTHYNRIIFCDKYGSSVGHRLGTIGTTVYADNNTKFYLSAGTNTNPQTFGELALWSLADGTAVVTAPSTLSSRSNGTDVLTRDWIPNDTRIVHTNYAEIVAGQKTFVSDIIVGNHDLRAPDDNGYVCVCGGAGESYERGARLSVAGVSYAGSEIAPQGGFTLRSTDGSNHYDLTGDRTGLLTWCSNRVWAGIFTSGSGNAVTDISIGTDNVVTVTKGSTFLTSHQSLANYVTLDSEQTITGKKCFSGGLKVFATTSNSRYIDFINTGIVSGTAPSSNVWHGYRVIDKNDVQVSSFNHVYHRDGSVSLRLAGDPTTSVGKTVMFKVGSDGGNGFYADASNDCYLGYSNYRWKEVWCTQSSINSSSDARIKTKIDGIPDNVLDAWESVEWLQYKFIESEQEKGKNARYHTGTIAQRVNKAFSDKGLDASKYGLFLYDEWEETPEEKDETGNILQQYHPAGNAYGLRYVEALCMEAAYQRRENARLRSRIVSLEERLAALELKIS